MKAVTEFASFTLNQAIKTKAALSAEGKTPEEIQESIGQTFKCEGEKLGYLMNAIDVAGANTEGLKRVMVMSRLKVKSPAKSEAGRRSFLHPRDACHGKPAAAASDKKGGHGGRGRDGGGKGKGKEKEGKWGLSPEELAAKKKGLKQKHKCCGVVSFRKKTQSSDWVFFLIAFKVI